MKTAADACKKTHHFILFVMAATVNCFAAETEDTNVPSPESQLASYYATIPALFFQAKSTAWSGEHAVSQREFEIRFVRSRGWYVIQIDENTEKHTWSDASGCHTFEVNSRPVFRGFYRQTNFVCSPGEAETWLGWTIEESILSWLLGAQSSFVDIKSCSENQDKLVCKKAGFRLTAMLNAGRMSKALIRQDTLSLTESLEISEQSADAVKTALAPDPQAMGLFTMDATETPAKVFALAAGGNVLAARKALLFMQSNQMDESTDMTDVFRALETAYRAKLAQADFYSAQFYSVNAAQYRPSELKSWSAQRLRAEFKKRMTEAASICTSEALNRMQEGCLELDCEGDTPQKDIALLSYRRTQNCEAQFESRFSKIKRPAWTRLEFQP